MGNPFTKYFKVDLYKWSSSEFPEEYALIYTSLDDESKTSTLRLSVNTDEVLCRHADNMCNDHPVRFYMKVTALRDSNGDCKFQKVIVVENRSNEVTTVDDNYTFFKYYCDEGRGNFTVKSRDHKLDRVNLEKTYWEFCHTYGIGLRRMLKYFVSIYCNKVTGLCVGFSGPFIYNGLVFEEELGLQSKHEVFGEPPKALIANVESKLKGKLYTLFQGGNQNGGTLPSAQATGDNNTGGQNRDQIYNSGEYIGNFNGAIINNCQLINCSPSKLARKLKGILD